MQILMTAKEQIGGILLGTGTTLLSLDQFIAETTPVIKYIGLVAGTLLTIVMLINWAAKTFRKK